MFFLLMVTGCSNKVVPLTKVVLDENNEAASRLARFRQRPSVNAVDMDVHLGWKYLGQQGAIDAILVLQAPSWVRMTALDPLGRSIFIISSDGTTFTMADNRSGIGYRGKVTSRLWRKYVPEAIRPESLFYFLGAMLPAKEVAYSFAGIDGQGRYWYQFEEEKKVGEKILHRIMLSDEGLAEQYLLVRNQSQVMVRFIYQHYLSIGGSEQQGAAKVWPGLITVDGEDVQGEFSLEVKKMVSNARQPLSFFTLHIPLHYEIETLSQ
jgi:hypothetical protein